MWQFSSPEIVYGQDALSRLADLQGRQVVIVTDETLVKAGFTNSLLDHLAATEMAFHLFSEVEPEPSLQTMARVRRLIDQVAPDHVIALGGGSVLDVAKVAWFLHEHPGVVLEEVSIFTTYASPKSQLIAIPTTSGSGADVTVGAVMTDLESRRKLTFYARELQPSLILVDPMLTATMPQQLTADSGMDVVSHAVEAFTGAWHNDFSDALSVHALNLALRHLPQAWRDGTDELARERMHNAATMAGLAITNASVALGHALAHSLGACFLIPHGRAVGVMLPFSMVYTANGGGTRYGELARALGLPAVNEREGLASLLSVIEELKSKISQPMTIAEMGVTELDFEAALPDLAKGAAEDHQMLTSLRVPEEDELIRLFRCAYDGSEVDF